LPLVVSTGPGAHEMTTSAITDSLLTCIVPRLAQVSGVVGIVLGGSRARDVANTESDYDIGLYYGPDEPLDTEGLLIVAKELVEDADAATVTPVGGWGPRIIGGGWLTIEGCKVDLLYRGIDPVRAVISDCRAGRISMDYQPGHPHGFCSAIWMGEIALCRPLHDPLGLIAELKASTSPYPDMLREALFKEFLWEVLFSIENGEKAIARGDQTHVAGCAYRALSCAAQVLFALNRRYLINEKGALSEAADFPCTIPGLLNRANSVWATIGRSEFAIALSNLRTLDAELRGLAQTTA
jgi:predicted nucleotidyltransferase